jgi:hypothetical protein
MSVNRYQSIAASTALAASALFGAVGSAQAAVYTGSWDPAFGAPVTDLGWSATATFQVDDSCLTQGTGTGTYFATGVCSGFQVTAFDVTFYDLADPAGTASTFSILSSIPSTFVTGIQVVDNQLTGLRSNYTTGFLAPAGAAFAAAGSGAYAYYMFFDFDAPDAEAANGVRAYMGLTPNSPAYSNTCFNANELCVISQNYSLGALTPAIPEPGTYALMLAGLGVMGFIARRRRAA